MSDTRKDDVIRRLPRTGRKTMPEYLVFYVRTLTAVESRNPDVLAMYERAIFDAIRNFADGN